MKYMDKDNKEKYVYQTSWGMTTRIIGAMIMTHSDDHGLVLPPNIAPTKVVIVPIGKNNEEVLAKSYEIARDLKLRGITVDIDNSEKSPGFRFAENEMKGIPVRIEIGPKDLENDLCVLCRRDTLEKTRVELKDVEDEVIKLLADIQTSMYVRAKARRDYMTKSVLTLDEMKASIEEENGFIKAHWCGSLECELKVKEVAGVTSRCIPFDEDNQDGKCCVCGKPAAHLVYWGKQY